MWRARGRRRRANRTPRAPTIRGSAHAADYVALAALFAVVAVTESAPPYLRSLAPGKEEDLW